MVDLAAGGVDLVVEVELDVVLALEGRRGAGEGERRRLEVDLGPALGDVGDGDGQVDEVALGVGAGRALGPQDWRGWLVSWMKLVCLPCKCFCRIGRG